MAILSSAAAYTEGTRLAVYRVGDAGRQQVEALIRSVYQKAYGAQIDGFAPVLVTWETAGEVVATAGYRSAEEPLFLERYLDRPIESALMAPHAVARSRIVEVGHLTSVRPGEGRRLIVALAVHLSNSDVEWVASTVTAELRQLVVRLGLGAVALASARRERLGVDGDSWGSYFDHDPIVMAGHLPTALRRLKRRTGAPS